MWGMTKVLISPREKDIGCEGAEAMDASAIWNEEDEHGHEGVSVDAAQ
jgi:hypothetical protein